MNNKGREQIMIDGLSCDNCPDAQRCKEQQAKKEYAINQVLQDIPSEYANVIGRLKQIIPSITRCDYVLEKQLKREEQENGKYEQTLAEIKRIAEENIRIADLEGLNGVYRRGLAEQILQKISEVLDG